ncbi:amino acid ABC transporter substrate-binding protein, PAAT family [Alkalispirochaeta americana]|uniref:Amino acid ABC transporter substrate-binding protein, PAAT family n=1 Tax=Alkalispirochaeta americana TaxID=159291 RepID=A0A1N6R289_9SPIO|nr:transporter substrate-binding domain-containing protein [Alkalispirochaeta americana]SIQ22981.1 amino acid ABC transporter substrate-binding protein, PAAT family [Alkalispirochaeta americana]
MNRAWPDQRSLFFLKRAGLVLVLSVFLVSSGEALPEHLVLATDVWPPFRLADSSGDLVSGIDLELVREIETRLGIPVVVQRHSWPRALEMLRTGEAHIMTGIAWSAERETYLHYLSPSYTAVSPAFYTLRGSEDILQSYRDLYSLRVGQVRDSVYFEPFNSDTKIEKITVSSERQLLRMLYHGRVSVLVGTIPNLLWDIRQLGMESLVGPAIYQPAHGTDLFIALSRASPAMELRPVLEKILRDIIDEGVVATILEGYR